MYRGARRQWCSALRLAHDKHLQADMTMNGFSDAMVACGDSSACLRPNNRPASCSVEYSEALAFVLSTPFRATASWPMLPPMTGRTRSNTHLRPA